MHLPRALTRHVGPALPPGGAWAYPGHRQPLHTPVACPRASLTSGAPAGWFSTGARGEAVDKGAAQRVRAFRVRVCDAAGAGNMGQRAFSAQRTDHPSARIRAADARSQPEPTLAAAPQLGSHGLRRVPVPLACCRAPRRACAVRTVQPPVDRSRSAGAGPGDELGLGLSARAPCARLPGRPTEDADACSGSRTGRHPRFAVALSEKPVDHQGRLVCGGQRADWGVLL